MKSGTEAIIEHFGNGTRYEPAALGDAQINPNALTVGNHTYPTLIINQCQVALCNTSLYEHNGRPWFGDPSQSNPKQCTIAGIVVPVNFRGEGRASEALSTLVMVADKLGITLALQPAAIPEYSERGNGTKLRAWYARHGFVGGVVMTHPPVAFSITAAQLEEGFAVEASQLKWKPGQFEADLQVSVDGYTFRFARKDRQADGGYNYYSLAKARTITVMND